MTVLYRSGLMLTPPVALAGHAFTRTNHPGQWHCLRCHTLTPDIHHTTINGTCTGLAAAITTGAPMTTTAEPTIPVIVDVEFTATASTLIEIPLSQISETVDRLATESVRLQTVAPSLTDVLNELAPGLDVGPDWNPSTNIEVHEIEDITISIEGANNLINVQIAAELERFRDEHDPERARLRPSIGQLDIFGNEVTQ